MPKIGKKRIFITSELNGNRYKEVDMFVNSAGLFYVPLPLDMEESIKGCDEKNYFEKNKKSTMINVFNKDMESLLNSLMQIYQMHEKPDVYEVIVIAYNIESHVSFSTDEHGKIHRNAEKPGTKWVTTGSDNIYGGHHSSNQSEGGFSLTIGAMALKRITIKNGSNEKVKYELYNDTEAAKLLNKWCSFSLPEDSREMPYTDKAATFFDELMFGMANVSKMIQERTSSEEKLLTLIASGTNLLGSSK